MLSESPPLPLGAFGVGDLMHVEAIDGDALSFQGIFKLAERVREEAGRLVVAGLEGCGHRAVLPSGR